MGKHGAAASPATVQARADVWRRVERYTGAGMRQLEARDIELWITAKGRDWAPATLALYLAHIRAYYRQEGLPDPTEGIRRPRVERRPARTAERIARALEAVDPVEWALAGQDAGRDAAAIARSFG